MSKKRQTVIFVPTLNPRAQVTTLAYEFPPHHQVAEHFHEEGQLLYASRGVMNIRVRRQTWIIPPQKAVWIPAKVPHSILMSRAGVSMRTVYLAPRLASRLAKGCRALHVSSLLRELILYCCERKQLRLARAEEAALVRVLLKQIEEARAMPLVLPHPLDPRAIRLAEAILRCPGDERSTQALCREAGGSKRTLERLFLQETGLSLGRWRQRARLLFGLQLVSEGAAVTQAALDAGYASASAFIAMFRHSLGTTPRRYLRQVH